MGKESRGRRKADKAKKRAERGDEVDAERVERDVEDVQNGEAHGADNQSVFFGLVDRTELEYFKQAESTLAANAFGSPEEREGFVRGVFEEAKGKELKLATNQICSKLVERLTLEASDRQLARLLKAFSGHFGQLSRHKYASHCVETLFVRAAGAVEREMLAGGGAGGAPPDGDAMDQDEDDEELANFAVLMEFGANEVRDDVVALARDPYGTHVVRLLLLVLSGSPLPAAAGNDNILRSRKSRAARRMIDIGSQSQGAQEGRAYQVPSAFGSVLQGLVDALVDGPMGNDTTAARKAAIDSVTSPVVQVLVKVEGKARRVQKLVFAGDDGEGAFVEHLLSDAVGSHFFEAALEAVPTKVAERLYGSYVKGRLGKLARRRDSGSYVVRALLKRLRVAQVREMLDELVPELGDLMSGEHENLAAVRAVCDAAVASSSPQRAAISKALLGQFAGTAETGTDDAPSQGTAFLDGLLQLSTSTLGQGRDGDWPTPAEMQRSLLLQSAMKLSPQLLEAVSQGLLDLGDERLSQFARHSVFSHALEQALQPSVSLARRRPLAHKLAALAPSLALNVYGSHIVDGLWRYTYRLKFIREQVAAALAQDETAVKNSPYGKLVWKNWQLDKYVRRRHEWWAAVKASEDEIAASLGTSHDAVAAKQGARAVDKPVPGPGKFQQRKPAPKPYDRPFKHRPKSSD